MDIYMMDPLSRRALKGWARRRLNRYLRDAEWYLGEQPKSVTVWAEDFDLLEGHDDRVELRRGAARF